MCPVFRHIHRYAETYHTVGSERLSITTLHQASYSGLPDVFSARLRLRLTLIFGLCGLERSGASVCERNSSPVLEETLENQRKALRDRLFECEDFDR